jgi:2,4-dienoyl-CoA reductase-like NADH-dependent reductase (Old Yellow Enzyme family)/thioredoxin reductase
MGNLDNLFEPLRLGSMDLRNRIMLPPHGAVIGNLWGSRKQAEQNVAYWASRARDGAAWIDGITGFVDNSGIVPPGFIASGSLGAVVQGVFRLPHFVERARMYGDAIHEAGACATSQLVLQGGVPHSPSARLANYTNNIVPHVLTGDEIRWLVDEYAFSAGQIKAAGLDGLEIHANHEDLMQLFLSPATNRRDDEYGGDAQRRLRFITEALAAMRAEAGANFTIGIRFNLDELFEGGYGTDEGIEIAKALEATGNVDYIHGVMGSNWGAPSYIQSHHYGLAQWSALAGRYRAALDIPLVYTGRVSDVETAAQVLAEGHADVVGMARAMFADAHVVSKARSGRADVRPCIGCNDCLHAVIVEDTPFGCAVNPRTGRETEPEPQRVNIAKRVLVVGGGPAGLELAGSLAERGHDVALWERESVLGGQMHIAAMAAENGAFGNLIDFQTQRLDRLGVAVTLDKTATAQAVLDFGADVVALATGADARVPEIEGTRAPFVVEGRDVMRGAVETGERVVVIAREDHMQPLTIAGFLVEQGKDVQLIYQTPAVAPVVGKYSIGAPLAKFAAGGGTLRMMERVVEITQGCLHTRNVYSGTPGKVENFDTVVLACGGEANTSLYASLADRIEQLHVLGDAFAPRRIWFATRQAYELAQQI